MKRMIVAVMAFCSFISMNALLAQPMSQGKVTYQVVEPAEGMPKSVTLSFSKNKSRWDWTTNAGTISQIIDPDLNKGGSLQSEKGTRYFNPMTESELLQFTTGQVRESRKSEEQATIAGIKAGRNLMIMVDPVAGDVREMEAWMDATSTSALPSIGGIPGKMGLPLEFDMMYAGSTIHLKATAVSRTPVDAAQFSIPKGLPVKQESIQLEQPAKLKDAEPIQSK